MKRLLTAPRRVLAVGAVTAIVVVVAAGYGWAAVTADNQTYTGCLQNGDLTSIAVGSTPFRPCPKNATQISWSQTGPAGTSGTDGTNGTNGTNGASVTSATEAAGANCASGGARFTALNGVTYACNGAKGDQGLPGQGGAPGQSLTATPLAAGDSECNGNGGVAISTATDASTALGYVCNGAPGAPGEDGEDGRNGQDGTSGSSLIGSPCSLPNNTSGTVQMSVAAGGAISFVCQTGGGGTDLCADVPTYPNGTTSCDPATGTLSIICSTGYANADNNITNGCETNLMTSPANCGAVGNAVNIPNATGACVNGQPTLVSCFSGFANVDGNLSNGCEVNLMTSTAHCGAVGNAVNIPNATGACAAGVAVLVACNPGWFNVNGSLVDGCEFREDGFEPNDSSAAARLLSWGPTFTANVAPQVDEDWFRYNANCTFLDLCFPAFTFNGSGTMTVYEDGSPVGSGSVVELDFRTQDHVYTVRISGTYGSSYTLQATEG